MKSLVRMELKPMTENCAGCTYASRGKHFHKLTPMNTKIDELFATLRGLISDQSRDLALAMAGLANVAAERDSFKAGRADLVAVLATYSAERDKAQIECCEANARADFADLAAERRGVELEKLRLVHRDAVAGWNKAALERDNARQSLRAAEQEVEEIDTLCNDFRRANSRLVAERDAAMERLNHAESIIMQ